MKEFTFTTLLESLKKLLVLNGIFLFLMSLYRFFFFLYFADFKGLTGLSGYVFKAFFLGLRYDLAILAYLNAPVTLALFALWGIKPVNHKNWLIALKGYYTTLVAFVFFVLLFDFGFYLYFKNHINILIFGVLEDDTAALASTIWDNYPVLKVALGFCGFVYLIYRVTRYCIARINTETVAKPYTAGAKTIFVFLLITVNFLAARGSFGLFPLGVMDAAISPNVFINKLAVTGIHTLQEAVEYRMKENAGLDLTAAMGYTNNIRQAFADLLGTAKESIDEANPERSLVRTTKKNTVLEALRPHVIVIVMEGFGSDLITYNSNEFNVLGQLKQHFGEDYYFPNFLSGDIGTIGSLESVLLSLPKRPMAKALSQSKYAYSRHPSGAGGPFKRAGYETIFLYGGNSNWRNMLSILPNLGFDVIEGEEAMDPQYQRNQWGVYDEFLFDHIYKKLSDNTDKPKFIFVMTTSNHPPYSLPSTYTLLPLTPSREMEQRITGNRKLAQERFKTYQYANQRVGEFISRIKASPLSSNTIIAITGDHNFWDVFDYAPDEALGHFGVPFYLYVPPALRKRKVNTGVFASHIDIMPTVYNLALSGVSYVALGKDILDDTLPHIAMNVDGIVMATEAVTHYSAVAQAVSYYVWDTGKRRIQKVVSPSGSHGAILKHYKAVIAVTEHLIRHPFEIP